MSDNAQRLIWIDLEMTGLDPSKERIIEMAVIITDLELNEIAQSPVIAVKQSDALLSNMDEWNTEHHTQSGLVDRVKKSEVSEAQAEQMMLSFLSEHVEAGSSPMCGNSVHQDRRFLQIYMPALEAHFHYRNLDVSTLKSLAKYWKPEIVSGFTKKGAHLALDDIKESIEELRYYRQHLLSL